MTNILIADDHELVRDTIAAYLETVDGFHTFSAPSLDDSLAVLKGEISIDLAILDYNMPGMNGLQGIETTCKLFPQTKVALMSGVASRDVATAAIALGAGGFLPKSLSAKSLVNAIRFVLAGEQFLPVEFSPGAAVASMEGEFASLSKRELQTLEQLCAGLANKEIARNLGIQEVTVKLHVRNLLAKRNVTNRTQAALKARQGDLF